MLFWRTVVAQDYGDKPAMQAVCALSAAASGRQFIGLISLGVTNLVAMRLDGADDIVVALWASEGQGTVLVAPKTQAFTMIGERLALQSDGAQLACPVTAAAGPVYLLFPRRNFVPFVAGSGKVVDDYDGDGRADPAGYAADGTWRIWLSGADYATAGPFSFGLPGAIPVAGDFDGDGLADPGVIVSNIAWHVWLSSDQYNHHGPLELTP